MNVLLRFNKFLNELYTSFLNTIKKYSKGNPLKKEERVLQLQIANFMRELCPITFVTLGLLMVDFSLAKTFDLLEFLKKENCALNIKYYPFKVAHKILFEENNGWMEKYHKDLVLKNTKLNPRKQDWFCLWSGSGK